MVSGEPQPERRTAEARIDTDGFFCNTAAVAAACNTYSLFVREDSLLPLAKLLLQRPACTQTGAIGLVNKECHSSPQCCAANES